MRFVKWLLGFLINEFNTSLASIHSVFVEELCLLFENYALTIWKSQRKVQVDCIAQEVDTSWAGSSGTACLGSWSKSQTT